jgi:hypothetical protein
VRVFGLGMISWLGEAGLEAKTEAIAAVAGCHHGLV